MSALRALLAFLVVADALQAGAPGAMRTRLPALSVRAQVPVELAEGEWGSAPIAAAGQESAEGLMQRVLEWLPDMLVNLEVQMALTDNPKDVEAHAIETAEDPDPEDFEFVKVGRPWLHTEAFHLATGATTAELGAAVWAKAEGAAFLQQGAGGGGLGGRCKSAAGASRQRAISAHPACLRGWGVPPFPEASLRPPRSPRRALVPERPQAEETLLAACFRSALLPPCVQPLAHRLLVLVPQLEADFALFEQVGAAVAAAARQARRVIRTPGARAAAQLGLRPPPSATSTWRAVRVAYLPPASIVAMLASLSPSISLDLRREINAELQVQACHPNAKVAARRCPVALFQFFLDSPDLYVNGNLADAFR